MKCAREGCECPMGDSRFELDGRTYCCEKCARQPAGASCQCNPGDCH